MLVSITPKLRNIYYRARIELVCRVNTGATARERSAGHVCGLVEG